MATADQRSNTGPRRRSGRPKARRLSRRRLVTLGAAAAAGAIGGLAISSSAGAQGSEEIVLTSPDGTRYQVKVDDSGNLVTTAL